ncbi:hypothetical protein PAMA_000575 [Pampus argenteus]
MFSYMFSVQKFSSKWRIISSKTETLTPRHLWLSSSDNCHTGPDVVIQPNKQKGARNTQVTKRPQKQRSSCQTVLNHFDQQYSRELGDLWTPARSVLLDPHSWQYGVLLNRFAVVKDIKESLQSQGFSTLLPQTDASMFLSDVPTASSSKYQAENCTVNSKCPSGDSHVQLEDSYHAPSQLPQSDPSLSLTCSLLQCYIHPYPLRFPSQAHRPGHLKQYYLLNAASLLPVLALQVRDGEKVLDLCSAPGGKALAIMQCATPAFLCCNEPDPHRRDWLAKTLESFLPHSLNSKVNVSAQDGRSFGQSNAGTYDKVLVDAPCSNDRSWLYSPSGQQGEQRLKERAKLPVLQAQLLRSALLAVRPGGIVVYSTCTLSSSENYAVVEAVLNDCPEAEPEDLWEEIAVPLSNCFTFSKAHHGHEKTQYSTVSSYQNRLGILVVPQPRRTWGPMFLSRIRRRK